MKTVTLTFDLFSFRLYIFIYTYYVYAVEDIVLFSGILGRERERGRSLEVAGNWLHK